MPIDPSTLRYDATCLFRSSKSRKRQSLHDRNCDFISIHHVTVSMHTMHLVVPENLSQLFVNIKDRLYVHVVLSGYSLPIYI